MDVRVEAAIPSETVIGAVKLFTLYPSRNLVVPLRRPEHAVKGKLKPSRQLLFNFFLLILRGKKN